MATETPAAAAAPRKKKANSPKAPGTSLRTAIAEVTKLYAKYSHGAFSRGEMASALSMSANSGAFLGKTATLREYGLIEETGAGTMKVSDLFKAIYSAPAGSAELKRNALFAIGHSAVFAGLLQQFSAKVPDEAALALRLETAGGFNRDRAQAVASAFRDSLAHYGLIDASGNVLQVREGAEDVAEAERSAPDESDVRPDVPAGPGIFRVEVPLGPGRRALLALPDDITAADTTRICAVLAGYNPAA
jgi:hypothetical protein